MQEWRIYSKKADFSAIGKKYGIDQVIARVIRNRDIEGDAAMDSYLNGSVDSMYDPMLMKDMGKAVDILLDTIKNKRKIRIIGDYDIDGVCSIYILFKGLLFLGADVDYEVPDRIKDGYGINENLIKQAYDDGREVILTCDNGIAATEQVRYARSLGFTVIVTDHHDIRYEEIDGKKTYILPEADAIVNPKQSDCSYPCSFLCGAGVAYKLMQELFKRTGNEGKEREFLVFAGIATVGDVVDLKDENRIFVKEGLKQFKETDNYGLRALTVINGLDDKEICAYHIGFIIGPCLNASGRLDTAKIALKMLLSKDKYEAERLAGDLVSLNEERKSLTAAAVILAEKIVDENYTDDTVLVIYLPDCHESIAGIVAGRIREKYYKPVIVLTKGEDGVKGSARSIESYNIFEKLCECSHLLTKFGGHPLAAGMSLKEDNIEELRKYLNEHSNLTKDDLTEKVWIDVPMPLEYINEDIINELSLLEPYGKGNEKPVFADKNLIIVSFMRIGRDGKFAKMELKKNNGMSIFAMCFNNCDGLNEAFINNKRISCTYYPEINEFRGNKKLQICITGYRIEEDI